MEKVTFALKEYPKDELLKMLNKGSVLNSICWRDKESLLYYISKGKDVLINGWPELGEMVCNEVLKIMNMNDREYTAITQINSNEDFNHVKNLLKNKHNQMIINTSGFLIDGQSVIKDFAEFSGVWIELRIKGYSFFDNPIGDRITGECCLVLKGKWDPADMPREDYALRSKEDEECSQYLLRLII